LGLNKLLNWVFNTQERKNEVNETKNGVNETKKLLEKAYQRKKQTDHTDQMYVEKAQVLKEMLFFSLSPPPGVHHQTDTHTHTRTPTHAHTNMV